MRERCTCEIAVRTVASSGDVPGLEGYQPFAAASEVDPRHDGDSGAASLIVRGSHKNGSNLRVLLSDCVELPQEVPATLAPLVLPLASGLAVWQTLGLELGEQAVVTSGQSLAPLIEQIAVWRGACPVVSLGPSEPTSADGAVVHINWADPDAATTQLSSMSQKAPGFAAVDLSGRADVIDILFEVVPRSGRLLLAGPPALPLTIDYYKNVHRKGIFMSAETLEPLSAFDIKAGRKVLDEIPRAVEILRNPVMAGQCQTLFSASGALESVLAHS